MAIQVEARFVVLQWSISMLHFVRRVFDRIFNLTTSMDDVTKHQHSGGSFQHGELHQSHIATAFVANVPVDLVRFGMTSTIVKPSDQFGLQIFVHTESN